MGINVGEILYRLTIWKYTNNEINFGKIRMLSLFRIAYVNALYG